MNDDQIKGILKESKTIAVRGPSANINTTTIQNKPSHALGEPPLSDSGSHLLNPDFCSTL